VRTLVWIGLLVALPVPLVLVGRGSLPPAAFAELAAAAGALALLERSDGVVLTLLVILLAQAAVWAILCGVLARGLVRLLGRRAGWVVVAWLVVAALVPVYRSPFHATRPRQTLGQVYR
jgi:hypothetical protein